MKTLSTISNNDFKSLITIRFNNISEGLENFSNGILEPSDISLSFEENQNKFLNFFRKSLSANDNYVIIDFYLKNLSPEEILTLLNSLDKNNKIILLQELKNLKTDSIYFSLDCNSLMDFITILNTQNLFFCTVYFKEHPLTIWGNYDLKFPVFFNDIDSLNIYKEIATTCGLAINSIVIKK